MLPRTTRGFLIAAFVVLVSLLSLTAAAQGIPGGGGGTTTHAGEMWATLVTGDGGEGIFDWELKRLISQTIGANYGSKILAFTQCYGGDAKNNLAGGRDTTVLAASAPGKKSYYNGYHRGLAQALAPGTTTDAAHQAGVDHRYSDGDVEEEPSKFGPNQNIGVGGDIHSCHVLVWAGLPGPPKEMWDWHDIEDIRHNFAGQPNTTVTVLAGNGGNPDGPGGFEAPDGAATFDDLRQALKDIGAQMAPDEQFILFVTDHGNIAPSTWNVPIPKNGHVNVLMGINPHLYDSIQGDPTAHPYVAIFASMSAPPIAPGTLTVSINGLGPYTVGQNVEQTELDYDGDGVTDQYEYDILVDKATLVAGDNSVVLYNSGPADLTLYSVSLDSGAIQRPVSGNPGPIIP